MTTKPARCCVLTQRGTRCANEPSPVRPVRMIGPVRLAACGLEAHQRALWSLPGFVRHDAYCGAFGCDRPSNAGICQKHRDQYRDFGITEHMLLAQEAPMTEPTITPAPADDGEPSEGDVADAPLFVGGTDAAPAELVARWGQVHTAPVQPMPVDLDGLAAIAARGQEPTAPGPTVADLQQQLAAERARADLLDAEAVSQRQRAEAVEAQLQAIAEALDSEDAPTHDANDQPIPLPVRVQTALMPGDPARIQRLYVSNERLSNLLLGVDTILTRLGAGGHGSTADWLMQVLPVQDQRALLEIEAADARADLARLRARRLNPAPPERVAELVAKVAALDARIAALDAG